MIGEGKAQKKKARGGQFYALAFVFDNGKCFDSYAFMRHSICVSVFLF